LQTNVDALLLSKLGSAESVGWHAAARKLVGLLIFPATALINALYPTLCRLHLQDPPAYRATAAGALHLTALAVMPVALSCALFPDVGIRIFSEQSYGPAADNLRILAAYILLVYFSMPLGCALTAAGRQHAWAAAQLACLVVGSMLDVLLIPWFQTHYSNGGLGVCVATLTSEVVMVTVGIRLLPAGVLDRALIRKLLAALLGAACMAGVAWVLRGFNSFVAAPPALAAYGLGVWCSGGIDLATWNEGRAVLRGRAVADERRPRSVNPPTMP
jgi:O-antigen/teichoic acid export membrane protein